MSLRSRRVTPRPVFYAIALTTTMLAGALWHPPSWLVVPPLLGLLALGLAVAWRGLDHTDREGRGA